MVAYAAVFAVACGVTLAMTPLVGRFARRVGAVVRPDDRRVHDVPTPTLGGLAMLAGFVAAMALASQLDEFDPVFAGSTEPIGVVLAAAVIFGVGLIDDLREVSAPARLAGMVLAGGILSLAGVGILFFRVPFGDLIVLSPDLSALLTILWVVGMANAVNLIDGLDGLAAGIVAIAAGAFLLYAERLTDVGLLDSTNISPLLSLIVLGMCLGFLPHNFNPAKIFMGDGGALMLGLLLAASTMAVGGRTSEEFSGQVYFFFAPLFIPLVILGVPIIDTLFAIVRRAVRRKGVATADKDHLHHRLMRLGHGQRRSVLILWTWTALLSAFVLYPAYTGKGDAIVPFAVAALGLALYTLFHPGLRRGAPADEDEDAAEAAAEGETEAEAAPHLRVVEDDEDRRTG